MFLAMMLLILTTQWFSVDQFMAEVSLRFSGARRWLASGSRLINVSQEMSSILL